MIPTGVSMVVSGGAVSPENRSNEEREIAEQYLYDGDHDRPLNAGYYALLDLADSVAALESAHAAALARIAAVEALPAAGASVRRKSLDETVNGVDPMSFEYGWLRAIEHVRAALAASPTPTGPEPATECEHGETGAHSFYVAEGRDWDHSAEYATCSGPATQEPTEETP